MKAWKRNSVNKIHIWFDTNIGFLPLSYGCIDCLEYSSWQLLSILWLLGTIRTCGSQPEKGLHPPPTTWPHPTWTQAMNIMPQKVPSGLVEGGVRSVLPLPPPEAVGVVPHKWRDGVFSLLLGHTPHAQPTSNQAWGMCALAASLSEQPFTEAAHRSGCQCEHTSCLKGEGWKKPFPSSMRHVHAFKAYKSCKHFLFF